jgi:hypothetical protein
MVKKVSIALVSVAAGVVLAAGTVPQAEPVAAKTAFWEMYKPARAWAADLLVLSLGSHEVAGVKTEDGKFAMWTAVFVSPDRQEARTFTYSVVANGNTAKGVSAGAAQRWTGSTSQSRAFRASDFEVDSDAAYKAALVKAGAWVKQHPDKKVSLTLGSASQFSVPVWYAMWGSKTAGYGVFVNAVSGALIKAR